MDTIEETAAGQATTDESQSDDSASLETPPELSNPEGATSQGKGSYAIDAAASYILSAVDVQIISQWLGVGRETLNKEKKKLLQLGEDQAADIIAGSVGLIMDILHKRLHVEGLSEATPIEKEITHAETVHTLVDAIEEVTGVTLRDDVVDAWTPDEFAEVDHYVQFLAGEVESDEPPQEPAHFRAAIDKDWEDSARRTGASDIGVTDPVPADG